MLFNLFNKKKDKPEKNESRPEQSKASQPEASQPESFQRNHTLTVRDIIHETPDAMTLVFDQPADKLSYQPGQFLTLVLPIEGKEVRRSYSLCSSPFTDDYPAVTIKRVASGQVSNYLSDHIRRGDQVQVLKPAGVFTTPMDAEQQRHLVMLGGGSGITPLMSLIKSLLHSEPHSKVSLIYANRDEESIIFKDQLDALQKQYPGHFYVLHILETPSDRMSCASGLITAEKVPELLSQLPFQEDRTEYFLCGPQGMMDNILHALRSMDIHGAMIHKESFVIEKKEKKSPPPASKPQVTADWDEAALPGAYQNGQEAVTDTHEVTIHYDGETYHFAVEPESTILETALALDIDLPYSCQSGLCTACMGKCTSGRMRLDEEDSLAEEDLKAGYVLTCVGHPLTSDVVIEIE